MRTLCRRTVAEHPLGAEQVHASTVLVVGEVVLVAWFAGEHEGAPDTRIQVARGRLDGTFSDPEVVAGASVPHWNPVLAAGPDGRVWLFFRRGPRIDSWTTWACHSEDSGRTWTAPAELVPGDCSGGRGPVRHAPLWYGDAWVAGGSVEVWSDPPVWDSFVDATTDGRTWHRAALPLNHTGHNGAGSIQPALIVTSGGQLVALTRATGGAVLRSETTDPYSWPPLEPCGLANNNSGLAAVTLPDHRIACVHNSSSEDWGSRSRLVISTSVDDGHTWTERLTLEDDPGSDGRPTDAAASGVVTTGDGEYSYPSASVVGSELWVTYTWQRQAIALTRVPLDMLAENERALNSHDADRNHHA